MKRSPLNRISKRRSAALPARRALVDRIHLRDQTCRFPFFALRYDHRGEIDTPDGPCRWPLDVHEIIPRSAWSAGWLDDTNCVLLCRMHHDWVGDNPNLAHSIGLHGFAHERTDK